jgi:light-regulated signal transduction histidine kinase (bacteriophytochrome)
MLIMIRCLIIDDNSFDRKVLRQAAERCQLQFRLHEAADIRSAENMLEVQNFDCIILDFLLPDGDGLSFARRFLETAESEFPVIMITGKGSEQVMREAFQLGILDYLTKDSVSPENLERVVVNAISKVRLQRARQAIFSHTLKGALRQFAAYVADDFKEPINEIKASCRSLSEIYHNALGEEGRRLLRAAEHAAGRAEKLIHSMFAYAHFQETGEQRDPVSLQSAVDDAVANLAGLIETAGATIKIGDLPTVLGVQPELMQLFRYLINNALEFRDRERALLVCIDARPVSTNTWEVSVEDNGTGLADDDLERMFNMSRRQDAYERSSIHLAACKRIVENHGGRLWCRSATGVGSTFVFTLSQDGIATPIRPNPSR